MFYYLLIVNKNGTLIFDKVYKNNEIKQLTHKIFWMFIIENEYIFIFLKRLYQIK